MYWHPGVALVLITGTALEAKGTRTRNLGNKFLALLITVPNDRYYPDAAANDSNAVQQALRDRGFKPSQILSLGGGLQRKQVLDFLRDGGARASKWQNGVVFLFYSGSGYWPMGNPPLNQVKTGWELGPDDHVLWDEVFTALDLPPGVRLIVLPDCCYTNTLTDATFANRVPKNVSGMVLKTPAGEIKCKADSHSFVVNGKKTEHGIITHYAAQALRKASTVEHWVELTNALSEADVAGGVIQKRMSLPLAHLGDPKQQIFASR